MELDANQIQEIIPHRPPFLLVDKITDYEPGQWAKGIKAVTVNEPFFAGHFPQYHVMPGVLIIEALAQVGAVAILSLPENKGKLAFFGGIKNARFKRQVRPGDVLDLAVTLDAKPFRGEPVLSVFIREMKLSDLDPESLIQDQELYERYRRGERLTPGQAERITPDRAVFAAVYRWLRENGGWDQSVLVLLSRSPPETASRQTPFSRQAAQCARSREKSSGSSSSVRAPRL